MGLINIGKKRGISPKASKLTPSSLRNFAGGWNAVDDDVSMKARFLVTASNLRMTSSGAQAVRFGNKWFANVASAVTGDIVDGAYFAGYIIVVTTTGQVARISDAGVVTKIWDTAIAALLPGAPSGWSATTQVDFVPFRDRLIIHNGTDKPIRVKSDLTVIYEQDDATGSNTNMPIGKYGCVVANFHCVAGVDGEETVVYIGSEGTSGVFPGDAAPNNAISFDVGAFAPGGGSEIRGIIGYRNFLIVFFQAQAVVFRLGVFNAAEEHTPTQEDTLPHYGLLGHRCVIALENDAMFADFDGMNLASRNLYAGLLDTKNLSDIIAPAYRNRIEAMTEDEQRLQCFMVADRLNDGYYLFTPDSVLVYNENQKLGFKGWNEWIDMDWTWGCSTLLNRVFGGTGTRVYQMGNAAYNEAYHADKLLDRDATWATATAYTVGQMIYDAVTLEVYTCLVAHTSSGATFAAYRAAYAERWELYEGEAITFDFELPWTDGRDPMKTKHMRFVSVQSKGSANFLLKAYADGLYKDEDGVEQYDPALEMSFVGNETPGFGVDSEQSGGGRRSGDPRLWGFPLKFKTVKFRITGSTRRQLQIIAINFLFSSGRFSR